MKRRDIFVLCGVAVFALLAFAGHVLAQLPPSKGAPKVGEKAPDFTLPDSTGKPVKISELRSGTPTVEGSSAEIAGYWELLIFYRGYWESFCNSELRSFQEYLKDFEARGVRIVAISVDPPDVTQKVREKKGYTYLFLSDSKREVIRRWDLVHPHGGIDGSDIARPAEFLIDPSGTIRWVNLTEDYRVRVSAKEVLKALDELHVAARAE